MANETKDSRRVYSLELGDRYFKRFGKSFGIPFGHDDFTFEDSIREREIALETGIPFEPGTQRWLEIFGPQKQTPEGIVI